MRARRPTRYCGRLLMHCRVLSGVTVAPSNAMLTTQDAADCLGLDCPTLVPRAALDEMVADAEGLQGCDGGAAAAEVAGSRVNSELLAAAVATRRHLGRLNDLIQASVIGLLQTSIRQRCARPKAPSGCASGRTGRVPIVSPTHQHRSSLSAEQLVSAGANRPSHR